MGTRLTRWLRVHLLDTPLESVAREMYLRLSRSKGVRYERELREVLRRTLHADSNCIDVGAHRGGVLGDLDRLAPLGHHLAFEPVPRHAEYLRRRFPRAEVHAVALGDTTGVARFHHIVSRPTYSGFRKVLLVAPDDEVEVIEVPVRKLDDMVPAELPIRFIKVDVEGAEYQVFRGGMATMTQNQPFIAFEHSLFSTWHYDKRPGEVYDLLADGVGLGITLMRRWLDGGPPLDRDAFAREVTEGREHFFLAAPISNI